MSTWLKELRGLWIITYADGIKIGGVQDVYLSADEKKVSGFTVKSGTLWKGDLLWLPIENVKKVGQDVILIPKEDVLVKDKPVGKSLSQLIGMPVDGKEGKKLGKAANIKVNSTNWEIKAICLASQEKIEIKLDELVLGEDVVLVQAGAALEPCKPPSPSDEKLKSDIGDLVTKYTSGAIKQGEELVHKATEAVKTVIEGTEEKKVEKGEEPPKAVETKE